MPTLKMRGGKLVLKGGKVSCSCCAPGCCMYPWPYDGDYPPSGPENLPDSVPVTCSDAAWAGTYTRVPGSYQMRKDDDHCITAITGGTPEESGWFFTNLAGELPEGVNSPSGALVCGSYLIGSIVDEVEVGIEAEAGTPFPTTFTIEFDWEYERYNEEFELVVDASGSVSTTVTRVSDCVWSGSWDAPDGQPGGIELQFRIDTFTFWWVELALRSALVGEGDYKETPGNEEGYGYGDTPVGTYADKEDVTEFIYFLTTNMTIS